MPLSFPCLQMPRHALEYNLCVWLRPKLGLPLLPCVELGEGAGDCTGVIFPQQLYIWFPIGMSRKKQWGEMPRGNLGRMETVVSCKDLVCLCLILRVAVAGGKKGCPA